MKKFTPTQLKRIAADLFKPTAKNPSPTLLRVQAAAKKLLTKFKNKKVQKATAVVAPEPIQKPPSRWQPKMVSRADLINVTEKELQTLTDAELEALKRQVDAAKRQRTYERTQ